MEIAWLNQAPHVQEVEKDKLGDAFSALNDGTEPVVIRNLVSHWPSVQAATNSDDAWLDYITGFAGKHPVTIYRNAPTEKGRIFYDGEGTGFNFQAARKPMQEVKQALSRAAKGLDDNTYYIGSTVLNNFFPGFRDENHLPTSLTPFDPLVSLWLGTKSRIAAHYDFPQNLACCVSGKRRFTLFKPDMVHHLYAGPADFTPAGQPISLVDFYEPDLQRFPKFEQAMDQAIVAELQPGDALFIPSMWWHHVEGLGSINGLVNYWWRNSPSHLGTPRDVLTHALLSLKSLPQAQKQAWKHLFDYYIFDSDDDIKTVIADAWRKGPTWQEQGLSEEQARQIQRHLFERLKRNG